MKKLSEGRKMWLSVMGIFLVYSIIFILFEDYDRKWTRPFDEASDWHLLLFSLVVMSVLAFLLHRYSQRMDKRINRERDEQKALMRRELTQNIAHELKTPVASILGYTDTILEDQQMSDATRRQFIERANVQARRLTSLLQDLSTLNRMDYAAEQLTKEPTDISQLVQDIVKETSHAANMQQLTICNSLQPGIMIEGNPSLLYSIFRNLIDNAIAYAGQGAVLELSALACRDGWMFHVSDNGVGISPEHLPRIFERFYRIDKSRSRAMGGTGLGLAIVKNAVQLHGGSITARTNPNGGLCFEFLLKVLS